MNRRARRAGPDARGGETLADTVIALQRGRRERGIYRTLEIVKSRGRTSTSASTPCASVRARASKSSGGYRPPCATRPASPPPRPAVGHWHGAPGYRDGRRALGGVDRARRRRVGQRQVHPRVSSGRRGATQLGKRSLVVSLDEHPAQILRNAELLGLGLQAQVEANPGTSLPRVPPRSGGRRALRAPVPDPGAQQIEQLVVDGLTTIRHALHDDRRFREFVHGLLAFRRNAAVYVRALL